ncbi:MAG: hypothetical protein GY803_30280, partial [Chloroflexi bacterium]|nr:hypothetical protein [Chloroflexota bacterium]
GELHLTGGYGRAATAGEAEQNCSAGVGRSSLPPRATPTAAPPATATNTPSPTATATPSSGSDVIYVSSATSGTAGGVSFKDQDILAYDTGAGTWSMHFDGSDTGLWSSSASDIDAFYLMADSSILISFVGDTTIPDIGAVEDLDIIRFVPTSLGDTTAGTFEWYFDGSDVGLTTNGENIRAITVLADGDLVISFVGSFSVSGASGVDEDLARFSPVTLGADTSGSWSLYFDGSDIGMGASSEEIEGTWIDAATGDIYLNTLGTFSVTGASGDGEDIFVCAPGSLGDNTSCVFSPYWDGSAHGYGGEEMDGFHIVKGGGGQAAAGSQTNLAAVNDGRPLAGYLPTATPGGPRPLKKTVGAHMAKPAAATTTAHTTTGVAHSPLAQTGDEIVIQRVTYSLAGQAIAVRVTGDPDGNDGLYYLHSDHLGSASAMSDADGALVPGSVARYTPFGDWRTEPTAGLTDQGYTGHKHNNLGGGADDLGLIYMNARY